MDENTREPADADETTRIESRSPTNLGAIGPYRIAQKIGEGGMGEVYLAWQTEPVRRKVALKVIKLGMHSKQVVARFESERQALALMEHPFIAKILDGGVTEGGRPYFVMEFVPGLPITQYCDQNRLSTCERLELFLQVCAAVQHAHHKAIVHRDLKPSNILVSEQDGKPIPKVIDFGVAKALGEPLTDKTVHTQFGQFLGTPKYMSPEQFDPQGQTVDTRSDVYSLGVILYELMVGLTPLDSQKQRSTPLDELVRRVREEEPELPSKRISSLGPDSVTVAQLRGTHPVILRNQLKGELDWITMKALEKNRSRRYGSPAEFAADIRRHLNDEIVFARPPSLGYRAGKFIRRNKLVAAVTSLIFISALTVAAVMTLQAERIARERDRANQEAVTARRVSAFLTNLFQLSDPMVAQGHQPSAREILDRGAQRIESELSGQPSILARLQATMAQAYENLGLYDEAEALYLSALMNQAEVSGPDSIEAISIQGDIASLHWRQGRLQEAEKELKQTIEAKSNLLGEDEPSTLSARSSLANLLLVQGRYQEAEQIYQDCFQKMQKVLGENDPKSVGAANNLALALSGQGKVEEAEKLFLWVLETRRRVDGENHPHTLGAEFNLAEHYVERRRIEEAERLLVDVLERRRRILGETHPETLASLHSVGDLYILKRDPDRAEQFLRSAYEGRKKVLGEKHSETIASGYSLGRLVLEQGRTDESRRLIQHAIDGWEELFGPRHPNILTAKGGLARAAYAEKRYAEAERLFREELEGWSEFGEAHPRAVDAHFNLACVSALQGKKEQALGFLREAIRLGFNDASGFEDPDLGSLRSDPEFRKLASALKPTAPE